MNVLERASLGRLKGKPDVVLDFNTEAWLSRPIWVGHRIEGLWCTNLRSDDEKRVHLGVCPRLSSTLVHVARCLPHS